ncbi:MAG: Ig-like domain-containing protein, partial [Pirellulaceae bacterium]
MSKLTSRLRRLAKFGRKTKTARQETRRRLIRTEQLEERRLLAGDGLAPYHNSMIPVDVNFDFQLSPIDALMIINRLNTTGAGQLPAPGSEGEGEAPAGYVDVNGDNFVSPADVLYVINALNAEGEPGDLIGFRLEVTDLNDNPISQIGVGSDYKVRSFVQDLRTFSPPPTGVFTFFSDINVTNYSLTGIEYSEVQQIVLSPQTNGGSFVLSLGSQNVTIPINSLGGITTSIQNAVNTFYGAGNATVARKPFDDPDKNDADGDTSNPFIWNVKFGGSLTEVDVQNMTVNASGLTVSGTGSPSAEVIEFPADPTDSRTFAASFNYEFNRSSVDYTNGNTGRLVTSGSDAVFDEVGGFADSFSISNADDRGLEFLFWEAVFHANSAGVVTFQGEAPDNSVSDIGFFNVNEEVDPSMVEFGNPVSITIVQSIQAVNDNATVDEDSLSSAAANNINVLTNDQLLTGTEKRLQSVGTAANGTVTRNDNGTPSDLKDDTVRYQPNANFFGTDTFTYVLANELGDLSTGTVNVTVQGLNDAPTTSPDTVSVSENSTATITGSVVTSNDSPGPNEGSQTLTVTNATTATGTVSVSNGNIIYTPPANFNGQASIVYTVTDNGTDRGVAAPKTATGTITVTVTGDNAAPTTTNDNATATEDTALTIAATTLTSNDSPGPNEATQTLTIVSVSGASAQGGTVALNGTNVVYTPPANYFGSDSFTYVIEDNGTTANQPDPKRATGTVNVTVNAVNDNPVATDDPLGTIDELTSNNQLDVLANDNAGPNEPSDSITIVGVGNAVGGTVMIATGGTHLLYTPNATFTGSETFTYTIEDSGGLQDTATVTFDVVPVVRPRAVSDRVSFPEGSSNNVINLLNNDLPNLNPTESIKLKSVNQPAAGQGTVTLNDNGTAGDLTDDFVTYSPPDAEFNGTVTFTYVVNDTREDTDPQNAGADSTGTVTVTITAINDTPSATNDNQSTTEDIPLTIIGSNLTSNDSPGPANESNQTLSVASVSSTSTQGGTVVLSGSSVVYTPAANFNGQDTFTYVVTDNGQTNGSNDFKTATGTVTVTVSAVNDAPVATNDTQSATEDTAKTIAITDLTGNDTVGPASATDETSSQQVVFGAASATSAQGGTVTRSGNNLIYTPAANFNGQDTFTYTITDSGTNSATATGTVTLNVAAVNDPPTAGVTTTPGDDQVTAFKNQTLTIVVSPLLSNDSPGPADEASQTLSATSVQATTALGGTATLSSNASGQVIIYTPPAGVSGQLDTITYTVSDSGTPAASANFTISVDIKDFQPSTISGVAYVDSSGDGLIGTAERRLVGVMVTLTGTNTSGQAIAP